MTKRQEIHSKWVHTPELSRKNYEKLYDSGLSVSFTNSSWGNDLSDSIYLEIEEEGTDNQHYIQIYLPNSLHRNRDREKFDWFYIRLESPYYANEEYQTVNPQTAVDIAATLKRKLFNEIKLRKFDKYRSSEPIEAPAMTFIALMDMQNDMMLRYSIPVAVKENDDVHSYMLEEHKIDICDMSYMISDDVKFEDHAES